MELRIITMVQNRKDIENNIVKIIDKEGNFYGTGFFIDIDNKKYCLTCHHCIYELDEIYVERKTRKYEATWIEKYSNMENDIAVLNVKDWPGKSLDYVKETLPGLKVFVWGFPLKDVEHFPNGNFIEEKCLSTLSCDFFWEKETQSNKVNKWNKKPKLDTKLFSIDAKFGEGHSGSPVFYSITNQVIGMLIAKDENKGYLIPMQIILEKFEFDEVAKLLKNKKAMKYSKNFMDNVKQKMDICFDHNSPHFIVNEDYMYKKNYEKMKRKKVKIRAITEIRKNNLSDCKKLYVMVDDLRHLKGVECGIAVSEDQYMTAASSLLKQELSKMKNIKYQISEAVYSTREEVVRHNQYIFNTLWENATPACIRFKQLAKNKKSNSDEFC